MTTNNDFDFFPTKDYELPVTTNYMKFQDGTNTFRILSPAIIGYVYFTVENKPIRSQERPDETPNIKEGGDVKHFWAFPVWNYDAKRIQILEITQKSLMLVMESYIKNPLWGNPSQYDFIVTKTGSGKSGTKYSISVNPKSPVDTKVTDQFEKLDLDLNLLYDGKDPFKTNEE